MFETAKKRFVKTALDRIVGLTNRAVDIDELQAEYDADRERVGEMRIRDLGISVFFQVAGGRLRVLRDADADGGFDLDSSAAYRLIRGRKEAMDPATGETYFAEYGPLDAVAQGDVRVWGEGVSTDILLLGTHVLQRVEDDVREEMRAEGLLPEPARG